MRTRLFARAVVRAISFPDQIEIEFQEMSVSGEHLGTSFFSLPASWSHVQARLSIPPTLADEIESRLLKGKTTVASLPREWSGGWLEPGDPGFTPRQHDIKKEEQETF